MPESVKAVVFHQPGKVASTTIETSLHATAPRIAIAKSHFLSPDYVAFFTRLANLPELATRAEGHARNALHDNLAMAARAHALLTETVPERLVVLTALRDPHELAVSAFFENLHFLDPTLTFAPQNLDAEYARVAALFTRIFEQGVLREPEATYPLLMGRWLLAGSAVTWFTDDYAQVHGLDLLAEVGADPVSLVEHNAVRHLVYRFDCFPACVPEIARRLGLAELPLTSRNLSSEKPYAPLSARFKAEYLPSPAMAEFYQESRLARLLRAREAA